MHTKPSLHMSGIPNYLTSYRKHFARVAQRLPPRFDFRDHFNVKPDLAGIARNTRFVAVDGRAGDLARLVEFPRLQGVYIQHAGLRALGLISSIRGLRELFIWELTADTTDSLASLRELRYLVVHDANRARTLKPIASLTKLEALHLSELRQVTDLSSLRRLTRLRDLQLIGGLWSKWRVLSLSPLENLKNLEFLWMTSVRVRNGRLSPLAKLRKLRYLTMENRFSLEECAALAGALPNARGNILGPFFSETFPPCRHCHTDRIWTTGKPTKVLCPLCDRVRIEHRRATWNVLVAEAAA